MQRIILLVIVALLGPVAAMAPAQPQDGDLILTGGSGGFTAYLDPKQPGTLTTLSTGPSNSSDNWVRMAPNNDDLVVTRVNLSANTSEFIQLSRTGSKKATLARFSVVIREFELDHDARWIAVGKLTSTNSVRNHVFGVDHIQRTTVSTYVTLNTTTAFNGLVIDRDPGERFPYTIVTTRPKGTGGPIVLKADRQGMGTIVVSNNFQEYLAVEMHPRTGDYIAATRSAVVRMSKSGGSPTTLISAPCRAIKILQDDTAWLASRATGGSSHGLVYKYCLTSNTTLAIFKTGLPKGQFFQGLEIYGSRTLRCHKTSAANVNVHVQSRHPSAGPTTHYALAASLARRPGLPFPHGEWLDLNTASCPLFYVTALNLLPNMFQNFRGMLNLQGNNAQPIQVVNIPNPLQGSGIPVFVAGVLYNQAGVFQVTNTHWFVL